VLVVVKTLAAMAGTVDVSVLVVVTDRTPAAPVRVIVAVTVVDRMEVRVAEREQDEIVAVDIRCWNTV
jgi:hypothetical protein